MHNWTGIRRKLEQEYLAPSLRGRIRYFATTYRGCPDQEGRAAILLDGKEILQGSWFNCYTRAGDLPPEERTDDPEEHYAAGDSVSLDHGMFDQRSFYEAFNAFDSQPVEASLRSSLALVRVFAVLDRRVGKRRLRAMEAEMAGAPAALRRFYDIRMAAEGLAAAGGRNTDEPHA